MPSRAKSKKSIKNLKRFKSAKFNYAKFVKDYYIEKGEAYISAKVNSIDDIISKYSTKGYEWINPEFASYIEESAYYIPIEERIIIEICGGNFSKEEQDLITKVLKDYFGLKLGDKYLDLDINKHKSFILFLFGIISLGVFAILSNFSIITAVNELLLLLFWFFLWEYADLGWLARGNLRLEQIEAGQLSTAKIVFFIIFLKTICSVSKEFSTSIFGSSGNSSAFIVDNLYKEPSHSITNKLFSLTVNLISELGNLLIISLNIVALTTVFPSSSISASITYSIPNSKSYVVSFNSLLFV